MNAPGGLELLKAFLAAAREAYAMDEPAPHVEVRGSGDDWSVALHRGSVPTITSVLIDRRAPTLDEALRVAAVDWLYGPQFGRPARDRLHCLLLS